MGSDSNGFVAFLAVKDDFESYYLMFLNLVEIIITKHEQGAKSKHHMYLKKSEAFLSSQHFITLKKHQRTLTICDSIKRF